MISRDRKYVYLFVILIIGSLAMCILKSEVPFKPVYLIDDEFVVSDEKISDQFRLNIIQVFNFYKVPYTETENGILMISRTLANDEDTLWNYTSKANNREWLENSIELR
ncbi:MAG TPA: hypothetical protein PKJ85_10235 [Nitrosomonas nitrosa]|nr:hypothetical protein [Nitrosomonas nitrosa]